MCNLTPGHLVFTGGNTHIYSNHMAQCKELLTRHPKELCQLEIILPDGFSSLETTQQLNWLGTFSVHDHFKLVGYESWPSITAPMAV